MALLITGFTPFGRVRENPSALVAEAVAALAPDVDHVVLPTEYDAATEILLARLASERYAACIALGVGSSGEVHIERFAYNRDDTPSADNAGDVRRGVAIVAHGPETYQPTLPIDTMYAAVAHLGIPVSYSIDPGRYVCNHVFYAALHSLAASGSRTQLGFVHLPMHAEAGINGPALPLELMVRAITACARVVQRLTSTEASSSE